MANVGDRKPEANPFDEDAIERGLQQLRELYLHDYRERFPNLRPGERFTDEIQIERIGRLAGVALKRPIAKDVPISPQNSSTGSHFGYQFDLDALESPEFAGSKIGKAYEALLEQTKYMLDHGINAGGGVTAYIVKQVYDLPVEKRAAGFAKELAYEGRTFRALLRAVRFVTCKPSARTALVGLGGALTGNASFAAAIATFLTSQLPWLAFCPPAVVAAIVVLISALGLQGFCDWSGPYLEKFTKSAGQIPRTVGDHG